MKTLRTSDIARAAGIHPNTVRQYEELGFLPRAERAANGYRQFTQRHLDQVLLVRRLAWCSWLGGMIHTRAYDAVMWSAAGDLDGALAAARDLVKLVLAERAKAEQAVTLLEQWVAGGLPEAARQGAMNIKEAAAWLAVTPDMLRNWDRNGLLDVSRDPSSGYRVYGPAELQRLLVIRALRRSRYTLMAILTMFRRLEADRGADPRVALDTLPPGEADIFYSTDRWLSKVKEIEGYAREAVQRLEEMARRYS